MGAARGGPSPDTKRGRAKRNLLAFLAAVVLTVAGPGWYLDWCKIGTHPAAEGHQNLSIDMNTPKIGSDLQKGEENLQKILEKNAKQAAGSIGDPKGAAEKKAAEAPRAAEKAGEKASEKPARRSPSSSRRTSTPSATAERVSGRYGEQRGFPPTAGRRAALAFRAISLPSA